MSNHRGVSTNPKSFRGGTGNAWVPCVLLGGLCFFVVIAGTTTPVTAQATAADESGEDYAERMRQWLGRIARVRVPSTYEKSHPDVKAAFRGVIRDANQSTVRVLCDQAPAALGVVVGREGWVLSKASELHGKIEVCLFDRRRYPAEIAGVRQDCDVALLKIPATNLPEIRWAATTTPLVGSWLASPGLDDEPAAIGVVSVGPRDIPSPTAVLGVVLEQSPQGPRIQHVVPGSSADRSGLRVNDVIKSLDGAQVDNYQRVIESIRQMNPGSQIAISVTRGEDDVRVTATLGDSLTMALGERAAFQNSLGGPLSRRRAGFPQVLQHDSALRPNLCGGAVVNLDGKAIGLNIARAGRVESFALPASLVLTVFEQLKAEYIQEGRLMSDSPVMTLKPVAK